MSKSNFSLTEGKSYGGRRVFASEKSILMSAMVQLIGGLKANLDRKLIQKSIAGYADLKDEFKDTLFGILGSYQKGEITADVMETMWRSEIRDAWEKAYGFGIGSVGNPFGVWNEDKSWLKGAETEEFGYLGKFVKDIRKDQLTMDVERRLGMYANTLDSVYFNGQVDGSPEFVKIHWILGESCKHCDDCIKLAAGSPYTKGNLKSTPRSGDSRCLSNCKCHLKFLYGEAKPEPEMKAKIVGPRPFKVPEGYRLPSDKERDKLNQMSTEIDRLRELIKVTSGATKKENIAARRDLNADLINFIERHKIYYVPGMQTARMIESLAKESWKKLLAEVRQRG